MNFRLLSVGGEEILMMISSLASLPGDGQFSPMIKGVDEDLIRKHLTSDRCLFNNG